MCVLTCFLLLVKNVHLRATLALASVTFLCGVRWTCRPARCSPVTVLSTVSAVAIEILGCTLAFTSSLAIITCRSLHCSSAWSVQSPAQLPLLLQFLPTSVLLEKWCFAVLALQEGINVHGHRFRVSVASPSSTGFLRALHRSRAISLCSACGVSGPSVISVRMVLLMSSGSSIADRCSSIRTSSSHFAVALLRSLRSNDSAFISILF